MCIFNFYNFIYSHLTQFMKALAQLFTIGQIKQSTCAIYV